MKAFTKCLIVCACVSGVYGFLTGSCGVMCSTAMYWILGIPVWFGVLIAFWIGYEAGKKESGQ